MSQGSAIRRPLRYRYYNATVILVVINVVMFLIIRLAPQIMGLLALTPLLVIQANAWWQVVTYMFIHVGFWHIGFNMLALYMFGVPLERSMGSGEFLLYYFVTGIGAGLATVAVNYYAGLGAVSVAGASGAIFAVLLAFASYFPDARILFMFFIPMRAPTAVLVFAAIELIFLLTNTNAGGAHLTHLAGLLFGWLYLVIRLKVNPWQAFFRRRW
jgi:membrane associated rhomboid family serine protease